MMNTMGLGVVLTLQDAFSGNARQAARSYLDLRRSFDGSGKSFSQPRDEFTKLSSAIESGGRRMGGGGGGGKSGSSGIDALKGSMEGLLNSFVALKGAGAGMDLFEEPLKKARDFGTQVGQIATISDMSAGQVMDAVMPMADAYGVAGVAGANALYETISAGVTDAKQATDLLATAAQFAVGGNSDLAGGIDVLTSAVNTYAEQGLTAKDASDALFVSIAAGKTTAQALSQSLGMVAPTAQAAGISFKELTGAVAALTVQGIATPQAVSGLNAMIANIAKPSKDATTEAKRLGIEWSLTALKGMGLQKFLGQLAGNAKVNTESFPKLFGSIEGIKSALALTAQGGKKFNDVMDQMANSSGATQKAFDVMAETSGFQAQRFAAVKENALILIGQALEPMAVAAMKTANRIIGAFNTLPEFWRDLIVKIVAGVALAATAAAAIVGVVSAVVSIGGQLAVVAEALGGAATTLGPLLAVVAALGLAFAALHIAVENDLGGLGTLFGGWVADAQLAFAALGQLFESGAISGPVMEDITKAENEGVLGFVTNIYLAVNRVKNFLSGIGDGFEAGVQKLEPVFSAFRASLEALSAEFGGLSQAVDPTAAGEAFDEWGTKGKSVGGTIAQVAGLVVSMITAVIDVVTGVVQRWDEFKAAVEPITSIFSEIGSEIASVIAEVSGMSDAGDTFVTVGNIIGTLFSNIMGLVTAAMTVVSGQIRGLVNVVGGVVEIIKGIFTGDWALVWHGFKRVVYGAVTFVISMLAGVLEAVAAVVDAIGRVAGVDVGAVKLIEDARKSLDASIKSGLGLDQPPGAKKDEVAPGPPVVTAPAPEAEQFGTVASVEAANKDAELFGTMESLNAAIRDKKPEPQQITVNVMLPDGQVLASGVQSAQADNANRSYVTTNP